MGNLTVKDTEVPGSVDYTFSFLDAKLRTAKVDTSAGLPVVTVDNAEVVDVVGPVKDNGNDTFTVTLHIADAVGAAIVTTDADADLGSGVTDVKIADTVSVIPGDAVSGTGSFGPVTPD